VDELIQLDKTTRALQHELDQAQARRKSSAKEFAKADDARRPSCGPSTKSSRSSSRPSAISWPRPRSNCKASSCWRPRSRGKALRSGRTSPRTWSSEASVRHRSSDSRRWIMSSCAKNAAGPTSPGPQGRGGTRLRADRGHGPARARGALLRPGPIGGQGLHAGLRTVAGQSRRADRHRPVSRAPRRNLRHPRRRPVLAGTAEVALVGFS